MAAIDFGNFRPGFTGVNMSAPGALGTAILNDFGSFNFAGGYRDNFLVEVLSTSSSAYVLVHGSFAFSGSLPAGDSRVFAIEVWTPLGYRLIVDEIDVSWATLQNGLTGRNLSALWAGEALQIHGHATLGDTLVGGALGDEIWGYAGHDRLEGNAGNDYLDGMGGRDTLRGGLGNDDYVVGHAQDLVQESAGQGIDQVITSIDYRLPANVEDLAMLNAGGAIDGIGNTSANFMEGNPSNNRLQGLAGDDTLVGLGGRDLLVGGDGNDALDGDAGADQMRGGAGNDRLYWDSADARVDGGAGPLDTLIVFSGSLDLTGFRGGRITDIERISLAGPGGQVLTLAKADVLALSSTTDTIKVLGGASDSVDVLGSFVEAGTSGGFTTYKLGGGVRLIVDADVDVV